MLLVEHNAGFVMEQSDRVIVLNLGTKLAEGLPAEIQQNQAVRDAYLGETLDTKAEEPAPPADPSPPPDDATPSASDPTSAE